MLVNTAVAEFDPDESVRRIAEAGRRSRMSPNDKDQTRQRLSGSQEP